MNFSQKRYDVRSKTHHAAGAGIKHLIEGSANLDEYLKRNLKKEGKDTVYIHIPFCSKICTFCNMRRSLIDPPSNYADLLEEQIKRFSDYDYVQRSKYDSIYFGGGTPTTLNTKDLRKILRALKNNLPITEQAEISVETSITELDKDKMEMLFEEGVNRFSIGVQTFSDRGRKVLGRTGTKDDVIKKINQLLEVGFSNINIDIIYNYPEQTIEEIYEDIEIASSLNIAGFSFYSLILDDRAQLINRVNNAKDYYNENFQREVKGFNIITEKAEKNGFDFLELTKMVRPNRDEYKYIKIRHGGGDTLPIGAGAGGTIGNMAMMNEINIEKFRNQIRNFRKQQNMLFKPEYKIIKKISSKPQFTKIDVTEIENQCIRNEAIAFLDELVHDEFVTREDEIYKLTKKGIFWGNNICRELSQIVSHSFIDKK